jgi:hypothetical protein
MIVGREWKGSRTSGSDPRFTFAALSRCVGKSFGLPVVMGSACRKNYVQGKLQRFGDIEIVLSYGNVVYEDT